MASESERCVDELLVRSNDIHKLLCQFDDGVSDELVAISRRSIKDIQVFIENNRSAIPPYILKKINDSLSKLERRVDESGKSKLKFKFKTPAPDYSSKKDDMLPSVARSDELANCTPSSSTVFFGFRHKHQQQLTLSDDQVKNKDISLIQLTQCTVDIKGLASTVYIRDLKNVTVTVLLACRAITVTDCIDCTFKLMCQQLRIDSVESSEFQIYTSARSMLESSKNLTFKKLKLDSNLPVGRSTLGELMNQAKFEQSLNNWNCIDDFDWLSPDRPSENYRLL